MAFVCEFAVYNGCGYLCKRYYYGNDRLRAFQKKSKRAPSAYLFSRVYDDVQRRNYSDLYYRKRSTSYQFAVGAYIADGNHHVVYDNNAQFLFRYTQRT